MGSFYPDSALMSPVMTPAPPFVTALYTVMQGFYELKVY